MVKVGDRAPSYEATAVVNGSVKDISPLDYYDSSFVVLIFYPFDFVQPYPDLIEFSDRIQEFNSINVTVIAVSTETYHTHLAWTKTSRKDNGIGETNLILLGDKRLRISKEYDVLDERTQCCTNALFIIDKSQFIRHISLDDMNVRRSVDETLRLLKTIR